MNRLLATTSIALCLASTSAVAEITPVEVWEHLSQQYKSMGYTVTEGSREEAGDTLTITDAKISVDGEHSGVVMTLPKLVMNQTGDGNVRWSLDGEMTGELTGTGVEGEDQKLTFQISMPGNETVSSGSVEDLTHEFKSDSMQLTMDVPVDETGATVPLSLTVDGVAGTQKSVRSDSGEETTFDSTATKMSIAMKGDMPKTQEGGPGTMALEGALDGLTMSGRMNIAPGNFNWETQMVEALEAGTEMSVDMGFTGSSGTFNFSGADETGAPQNGDGKYSSGPGTLTFAMSKAGLKYASSAETIDAGMTVSSLPFPVNYTVAKGGFDLELPVMASEQPAPFKLLSSISGLSVNDELWGLFDPQAKLPRDPADLNIDLSGELLLKESLLTPPPAALPAPAEGTDAEAGTDAPAMPPMPEPPVPVKLTINDVTVKAVGAEAHLKGELTAPEGGDMTTAPIGEISGQFNGVNALLDTLGAMGLIPEDQMMGTRMMLAMFAKPVEGETDKLETKLEFREGGSIFANGQQVK